MEGIGEGIEYTKKSIGFGSHRSLTSETLGCIGEGVESVVSIRKGGFWILDMTML